MKEPVVELAGTIVEELTREYHLTFGDADRVSTAGYAVVTVAYLLRQAIKEGKRILPSPG